jgi:glycosyltransferase involved in cell wall biosynthesis
VDPTEIERLFEDFELTDKDIIITFIGRLVSEKGIVELLEAFSNIEIENIKLLIVGDIDQGSRDQKTKNMIISNYKDHRNIIFTGFREDINNILYIADIFCLPSYREGMPRTIIEAMAMECAVIATDIRGCREEVIDTKTGFLVKVGSIIDINKAIEQLLYYPILLHDMKKEGRMRAERLYNEDELIEKQIRVLRILYGDLDKN